MAGSNFAALPKFVDRKDRPRHFEYGVSLIVQVFEIHKYRGDEFMYVVARTNKHSEQYVKDDVEKMNNMLTPQMKSEGIRYIFALGTIESLNRRTGDRSRKKDSRRNSEETSVSALFS